MADADAYQAVVKRTFRERALRSVVMIDDRFPTYGDLLRPSSDDSEAGEVPDSDRALRLYEGFKRRHMTVDVENAADEPTEAEIERFRKSDLIVLDYNLTPRVIDPRRSLHILTRLSESKHLNTVILYTSMENLDDVWINVAATLKRGVRRARDVLSDSDDDMALLAGRFGKGTPIREIVGGLLPAYIAHGPRSLSNDDRQLIAQEMGEDIEPKKRHLLLRALFDDEIAGRLRKDDQNPFGDARPFIGGCAAGCRWLHSGTVFVVVVGKRSADGTEDDDGDDPDGLMASLDEALLQWRPNLVQIVLSEVQNVLELEALATADELLRDPELHIGLSLYLLDVADGADKTNPESLRPAIEALLDRLLDAVRQRLSSVSHLADEAVQVLAAELAGIEWHGRSQDSIGHAASLAHHGGPTADASILFKLNKFLSTERFGMAHLTTGTIVKSIDGDDHWICAAPACDMTLRKPGAHQTWAHAMHPYRMIHALRLVRERALPSALREATLGGHVFIDCEGVQTAFRVVEKTSRQPIYEPLYLTDTGRVRSGASLNPIVSIARLMHVGDNSWSLVTGDYEVVGQLRSAYGSRLLQATGHHQSRIGVDFINLAGGDAVVDA